jgi:fructose-bisphosphate aldolase class II
MPQAKPDLYLQMLSDAKEARYALPAIDVYNLDTIYATLNGLAAARSDGILRIPYETAKFTSPNNNAVEGAMILSSFIRRLARNYAVNIGVQLGECNGSQLNEWLEPLLEMEIRSVFRGKLASFNSYTWDVYSSGDSQMPLAESLDIARRLLDNIRRVNGVLEVGIDVAKLNNDSSAGRDSDAGMMIDKLGCGERGSYVTVLSFGNVQDFRRSQVVSALPKLLSELQSEVGQRIGQFQPFEFVLTERPSKERPRLEERPQARPDRRSAASVANESQLDAYGGEIDFPPRPPYRSGGRLKPSEGDALHPPIGLAASLTPEGLRIGDAITPAVGASSHRHCGLDPQSRGALGPSFISTQDVPADISAVILQGVIKYDIGTALHRAYSEGVASFMFDNWRDVLKGGAVFDSRVWGRIGQEQMEKEVVKYCELLGSAGRTLL